MSSLESTHGTSSPRLDLIADDQGVVAFQASAAFELVYAGLRLDEVAFIEADDFLVEHDRWCQTFDKKLAGTIQTVKQASLETRRATWRLPEPYASLDLRNALDALCRDDADRIRVNEELAIFEARGLIPLIRAALYVTDTAKQHGLVVGVGRGSSVASHCLFLLGVHRVDSLRFGLDVREFVRD